MALAPGIRLRQYEIVEAIRAGRMDSPHLVTKLGREVAIKVLPEKLSKDRDRLARFEREAHR